MIYTLTFWYSLCMYTYIHILVQIIILLTELQFLLKYFKNYKNKMIFLSSNTTETHNLK